MEAPLTAPLFYPTAALPVLKDEFVGKGLSEIDPPALILDVGIVRKNCQLMLEATRRLNVAFRAHVKTHKTTELTKLQVGETSRNVNLVASTVSEIEHLLPWLQECVRDGKAVSILYGLPIRPSVLPRLAAVARVLGEGIVGVFVDHPAHITHIDHVKETTWPGKIPVFVNIDVGDHREGVAPDSRQLADITSALAASSKARLAGMYTHAGHAYASNSPDEALQFMADELQGLAEGAAALPGSTGRGATKVILSLGATPTVTAAQGLLEDTAGAVKYRNMLARVSQSFQIEFHAGNYPVLDMQQLATRARPTHFESEPHVSRLSSQDIAARTLVEVSSLYPDRGNKPEALVAGGSLVFGREPCKDYPGWGVVTPWPATSGAFYEPEGSRTGWILNRVSQEHGILSWEGPRNQMRQLEIGEKVMIWPNHACIAGAQFGWYLVVDSDTDDADVVRDVWVRWRGW